MSAPAGGSQSASDPRGTSPDWLWCLKIGLVVVLVDVIVLAVSQGQAPDSELAAQLDSLDQIVNILLFAYVGYRTGSRTARATAAAEAGVVASLPPAVVAALYQIAQPGVAAGVTPEVPLLNRVVATVALNIVLGGLSALFSGWLATRARRTGR